MQKVSWQLLKTKQLQLAAQVAARIQLEAAVLHLHQTSSLSLSLSPSRSFHLLNPGEIGIDAQSSRLMKRAKEE